MAGRLFMLLLEDEVTEDGKHVVKDLKVERLGEVGFELQSVLSTLELYTVFHKKQPLFLFFVIHSNDDQFT